MSPPSLRNHWLYNEVGDWFDIDHDLRNCPTCDVREDETHVVMVCQMYQQERERYILDTYKNTDRHRDNLLRLLNSEDRRGLANLAIFWRLAMDQHAAADRAYIEEIR